MWIDAKGRISSSCGPCLSGGTRPALQSGKWHSLSAVVDNPNGEIDIYLDGKLLKKFRNDSKADICMDGQCSFSGNVFVFGEYQELNKNGQVEVVGKDAQASSSTSSPQWKGIRCVDLLNYSG